MKRRETILGFILFGSLATYFAASDLPSLNAISDGNLSDVLTQTSSQLDAAQDELKELRRIEMQWNEIQENGLIGQPTVASLSYQEVLVAFLKQSGIDNPTIATSTPIPMEGIGHRILFNVQIESSLAQLGSFLDRIESSEILHRTKFLSIQQLGGGSHEKCSVSLILESLLIDGALGTDVAKLASPRIATNFGTQLATRHAIGKPLETMPMVFDLANLFSGEPATPAAIAEVEVTNDVEIEESLNPDSSDSFAPEPPTPLFQLVGILGIGDERRAMILQKSTDLLSTMGVNDILPTFKADSESPGVTIESIEYNYIRITSSDGERNIYIGETL